NIQVERQRLRRVADRVASAHRRPSVTTHVPRETERRSKVVTVPRLESGGALYSAIVKSCRLARKAARRKYVAFTRNAPDSRCAPNGQQGSTTSELGHTVILP